MIHMAVVVDGEQNFAVDSVAVLLDEIARWLGQPGKFLRRVEAVEALNEPPDLSALADEFAGENTDAVDRAFIEIGFHQQHRSLARKLHRNIADRIERMGEGGLVRFEHQRWRDRSGDDDVARSEFLAERGQRIGDMCDDIAELAGERFRIPREVRPLTLPPARTSAPSRTWRWKMSPASTTSRLSTAGTGSRSASSMAGQIACTAASAASAEAPGPRPRAMRTAISGSATGLLLPLSQTGL